MSIKVKIGDPKKLRIVAAAEKKPLITPDSITLGIDTVGQYIAQIDAGSGIVVTPENNIETANLVISHANTSTEISSNNAGLEFAGNIDLDQFGHITQFNNREFSSDNFQYSNNTIESQDFTLGTTSLTLGEVANSIVGLDSFEAGNVELFDRTFTANGDISLDPGSNNVINVSDSRISNLLDPIDGKDAINKGYLEFELQRVETTIKVFDDPLIATDATNKRYVDNLIQGFVVRPQALAATTEDLGATFATGNSTIRSTLTIDPVNFLYIDDVTSWTLGANLLVKDQDIPLENGSYNVIQVGSANTSWIFERAEFSTDEEMAGSYEFVTDGTVNGGTGWVATVDDAASFNIDTDDIDWVQFQGEGTFTAGAGLILNGTQFSVAQNLPLTSISPIGTDLEIQGSTALKLPTGTTAERPTARIGQLRFNNEDSQFEGYDGVAWAGLGGTVDVDQDTKIIAETSPGVDNDQLIFITAGSNAAMISANNTVDFYGDVNIPKIGQSLSPNAPNVYTLGASNFNFDKIFTSKIGSDDNIVRFDTVGAAVLPKGTAAQRPSGVVGSLRFNTEDNRFEGYDGTAWAGLAGSVMDLDRNTYIIAETNSGDDNNDLDFFTAGVQRLQVDQDGNINIGNGLNKFIFNYSTDELIVNGSIGGAGDLLLDPTNDINVANNTISHVADPVNPGDAVNLNYLDTTFSSKAIIIDGANTYPTSIDLLQNPTIEVGRGLEVENIDAANNELKIGLDVTGVQAAMYGTDGFTPRIRITEDGRIDFATDIPLELQANAIPNFTETSRDIIALMFTDSIGHEGVTVVNDDDNDTINIVADNFDITIDGDVDGTAEVTRLGDTTITATIAQDFVENMTGDANSGITFTTVDAVTPTTIELDYNHLNTIYAGIGGATFTGNIFAPRYYDTDNTNFFMDPAGESRIKSVRFGFSQSFTQLYFADGVGSQSTLYAGQGRIGFLNNTFGWASYSDRGTGNWVVENGDVQAERFVDVDSTSHYIHPGSVSNLHTLVVENAFRAGSVAITGRTISSSTSSGFDLTLNSDTNEIDVSQNIIKNLADPVSAQDATTKSYVDGVAQGLRVIPAALAATTENLSSAYSGGVLTSAANGALSIDGVTSWSVGDRVLVKDQTTSTENGSYVVTTVGDSGNPWVLTRGDYFDETSEIPGAFQFVTDGTINRSTGWVATVSDAETFVLDTDNVIFYQFSGAGTYQAGEALTLTGTTFSVTNPNISFAADAGTTDPVTLGETLTIAGGEGVDTTVSDNNISIAVNELDGGSF